MRNGWLHLLLLSVGLAVGLGLGAAARAQAPAAPAAPPAPAVEPTARAKGIQAANDGLDDVAERFFLAYRDAAARREPAFSDATILLLKTYLRQKKTDAAEQAIEYYRKGAAEPLDAGVQEALAYWHGAVLLAQGRWPEAQETLRPLAERAKTPEYRQLALEGLADACARQGKWPEAEAALGRILDESPKSPAATRARLGIVKAALAAGDVARATQLLDALRKQADPPPETTLNMYDVLVLLAEKKLPEALALFTRLAPQAPAKPGSDFWLISAQLGDALMAAGRPADALAVLRRSVDWADTPGDRIQSRLRRAECLIALNQIDNAVTDLESFQKEFPDAAAEITAVQIRLGDLLRQAKSFLTAAQYYGSVMENEKAPADLRYRAAYARALCFKDAGQFANASQAFSRAAKLGQTPAAQAECQFLAADAIYAANNYTSAALLYQSVADTYPTSELAPTARFNQGLSRAKEGQWASAALILKTFIETWPAHALVEQARLERGVALRGANEFNQAFTELRDLATGNAAGPLAAQALLEASQAAFGAANAPQAIEMLTRLIKGYPDSPLLPTAIYQRAHLAFLQNDAAGAIADCQLFLQKFPQSPLATDVLTWLGDHYLSTDNPKQGEDYYLAVATRFPGSPLASGALMQAAKSAFLRNDTARAVALTGQLFRDYSTIMPSARLAQAEMLQGDILASQGNFQDAIGHFAKVADLVPDTAIAFAAAGRLGDMYYSLGDDNPANLEKARAQFATLAAKENAAPAEREKARYRLAKVYEKLDNAEAAIKEYLDIVYQYDIDLRAGKARDWYYFARSGYDAARLLLLNERYLEAARLYERLAKAGIPTGDEAAAKALEIRTAHKLLD